MKKAIKILLFNFLLVIGLTNVSAGNFKIGETEYDTLKDAVAAVPTNGTQTTIEALEDVTGAPGVQIKEGQNIIIDFKGHTYETWEPMIGSKGTETQSFQLLKGSTVYMKNGNLIASTHPNSKMFIQNYADLTLEDISIDASTNTYSAFYAVSSNNGIVNIIGNTSIKVNTNTNARAFDMCWAPIVGYSAYNGGTQITVDTTGKINGLIELDVWGTYTDENGIKSTLTINNMDFEGRWSIDQRLANQLSITGGKYKSTNTIDLENYVTGTNTIYTTDNETFEVLPTGSIKLNSEEIYIQKGKTYKLEKTVTEGYEKYLKYTNEDNSIATIEDDIITAKEVGKTSLSISLGKLGVGTNIIVYDVEPEKTDNKEQTEINNQANTITNEIINKILNEETSEGIDEETINNVKTAVLAGKTVINNVEIEEITKEKIEKETLETLEKKAKEANGELKGILNIDILLKADNEELGKVTKLTNALTITVDVDKDLGNVPENTTRTYFVIRMHEGEEPTLLEATYKDGKLTFETDRFSSYAYGYKDEETQKDTVKTADEKTQKNDEGTKEKSPQTGDRIIKYVGILIISASGLYITNTINKKKTGKIKK